MKKQLIRVILFSLASSFLIYISKEETFFKYLINNNILAQDFPIIKAQNYCLWLGGAWAAIWLPIQHGKLKEFSSKKNKSYAELLKIFSETHVKMMTQKINLSNVDFQTKVFKVRKGMYGWLNKLFWGKVILTLSEIEGITDAPIYETLSYSVSKNKVEGLIGLAYFQSNKFHIDLDLEQNTSYTLSTKQKNQTKQLEFMAAIAIFKKSSTPIAVLTIESKTKLKFDQKQRKIFQNFLIERAGLVEKHI